jgi:hypothetical protein
MGPPGMLIIRHGKKPNNSLDPGLAATGMARATRRATLAIRGLVALFVAGTPAACAGQPTVPVALWLVPAQKPQRQLQEAISRLSASHSEVRLPVFQPHMTLLTGDLPNKNLAAELRTLFNEVDAFSARQKEIGLNTRAVDHGSLWSQFLFLALQQDRAPVEALDMEQAQFSFPALSNLKLSTDATDQQHPVMLHVSLMYHDSDKGIGSFTEADLNRIKKEVASFHLPDQIVFDAIAVVTPRSGDWHDTLLDNPETDPSLDILYTRKLQPPKSPSTSARLRVVFAGGQTGVDQAAWRAARRSVGLLTGGWCPPRRDIGDGNRVPDGFPCQETPRSSTEAASTIPRSERTERNVRDSDATFVILHGSKPAADDAGTSHMIDYAMGLNKHSLICDLVAPDQSIGVDQVIRWIQENKVETLNVGGPSEKANKDIGAQAEDFLYKVFTRLRTSETE